MGQGGHTSGMCNNRYPRPSEVKREREKNYGGEFQVIAQAQVLRNLLFDKPEILFHPAYKFII